MMRSVMCIVALALCCSPAVAQDFLNRVLKLEESMAANKAAMDDIRKDLADVKKGLAEVKASLTNTGVTTLPPTVVTGKAANCGCQDGFPCTCAPGTCTCTFVQSYADGYAKCQASGKPLVVFVNKPGARVIGSIVCVAGDYNGDPTPRIVVVKNVDGVLRTATDPNALAVAVATTLPQYQPYLQYVPEYQPGTLYQSGYRVRGSSGGCANGSCR